MRALALAALLLAALADARGAESEAPTDNFPVVPAVAERRLASDEFAIVESRRTSSGVMGARRLRLRFVGDQEELLVKWKAAPRGSAEGWNNSPRKEIGAYAVQKLFLDPDDYVVPTIVARCIPVDVYRPVEEDPTPTLEGTRCVYGALSLWLVDVRPPEETFDEKLLATNASYARHLANMNLLAYLIEHQDGRTSNFLISTDPSNLRVFSVDNGIAFGARVHNFFVSNWSKIRVPALSGSAIQRLRDLEASSFEELGLLDELVKGEDGILRSVEPGRNLEPSAGTRIREGRVQFGLTDAEIENLEKRLHALLRRVDAGEIPLL